MNTETEFLFTVISKEDDEFTDVSCDYATRKEAIEAAADTINSAQYAEILERTTRTVARVDVTVETKRTTKVKNYK